MSAQPSLQGTFVLIGSIAALAFFACHSDSDSANSQTRPAASSAKAAPPASTTSVATNTANGNQSHLAATYNDQRNELELANGGSGGASHSGHHKGKGGAAGGSMGGSKSQ